MKESTNNTALLIVGDHLLQAVARGDAVAVEGHALVYQAIVKSNERTNRAGE